MLFSFAGAEHVFPLADSTIEIAGYSLKSPIQSKSHKEFGSVITRKICKCNQFWGITVFKNIRSFLFQMGDKIICCGKRSMIAKAKYVSKNPLMKDLWIIYKHVKPQSNELPWVRQGTVEWEMDRGKAIIHKIIIRLHIATEICYNKEKRSMSSTTTLNRALVDQREFSKILSDYMLYLLLNQPNLMADLVMVVFGQMVFAKTLRELQDCIGDATTDLNGLCEKLYGGGQDRMPPGGRSTSERPFETPAQRRAFYGPRTGNGREQVEDDKRPVA